MDRYRFFGVEFTIGFDSEELREAFRGTYKHFLVTTPRLEHGEVLSFDVHADGISAEVVVQNSANEHGNLIGIFQRGSNKHRFKTEEGNGDFHTVSDLFLGGRRVMEVGPSAIRIMDTQRVQAYTESIVFHTVLSTIPSHYLLHAGVVSDAGNGVILCGEADRGKTTLTLGLVQAGFKFLSDEVAFLSLGDCTVGTFPRALGIRENTLRMFSQLTSEVPKRPTRSLSGDDKWLVDIEDLFPGSLGETCRVSHMFFLEGFADQTQLVPLTGSQSAMKCMRFLHTAEDDAFTALLNMTEIAGTTRCYELRQGPPSETVERVTDLITNDARNQ